MKSFLTLIIFAQLSVIPTFGQQFVFHSNSPFGIQLKNSTRTATNFFFYDYDFDGDQDLFLTGFDYFDQVENPTWENVHFFMEWQENTGDRWNPQFAPRSNDFDNFPYPVGYFFPTIADLNGDQIADFIVNAEIDHIGNQSLLYVIGEGNHEFSLGSLDTAEIYSFVPESFFAPHLVDLDDDGDLDLLMSGFSPAFAEENGADVPSYYYARNIGSQDEPLFQGWYPNPYGLQPNPFAEVLTSGDIDNDGDVDLIGATMFVSPDTISYIHVHLNNPEPSGRPAFTSNLQSPFGLPVVTGGDRFVSPVLVDLNGDGDLDFMVLDVKSDTSFIRYYENNFCTVETSEMAVSLCEGDTVKVGGNTYIEEGNYSIHLPGSDGCDSIVNLTIDVVPPISIFLNESICEGQSIVVGDEIFTATGDYTVYVVASNGCDSVVNLSLTVHEIYQVDISETLCEGETYHVGNEIFTVSGQYDVLLNTQEGCDSTISLNLNFIHLDNAVTVNENILTSNQPFSSYQWFNCDTGEDIAGATGQSFVATSTGNYAVRIMDGNGCSAVSACITVVISSTAEPDFANQISIYPNPGEDLIFILNRSPYPLTGLTVTNQYGQKLYENLEEGMGTVDVSQLEPGMYYLMLELNGLVFIKKLILN